jgi:FAD/FMN-containing dehydrogenase
MATASCVQELRDAVGAEKVRDDEIACAAYASDFVPGLYRKPDYVVLAESSEDVQKVLPIADKYKVPVTVLSAGANVAALTVPLEHGLVLDLRRMNKIIEINTDAGYAVVESGVTFDEFTAALRKAGYRCHITTAPPAGSVVGNYLSRSSGTFCTRHLDPMIDLEVVFPDGKAVRTGSSHFPGAGMSLRYGPGPDMAGMFCLAHGTMGIVTKASVRIYPITESNRLLFATFNDYNSSLQFVKDAIHNNLGEHYIIYSWRMWLDGFAKGTIEFKEPPKGMPYNAVTISMWGYEESIVVNEKICERLAGKYGGKVHTKEDATKMMMTYQALEAWYKGNTLRMEPATLKTMSPVEMDPMGLYIPWIVMAEPKDVVECEKWAVDKIASIGCGVPAYYSQPFDFGRSIFLRLFIYPDGRDKDLLMRVIGTYNQMYGEALERYRATPFRARGISPWLTNAGEFLSSFKRIKKAVDPNNILNPHLLGEL